MTQTDNTLTPEGEEKKKRIVNHPAYKAMFENAMHRVNIVTWLAVIGWIGFIGTWIGIVIVNHLK